MTMDAVVVQVPAINTNGLAFCANCRHLLADLYHRRNGAWKFVARRHQETRPVGDSPCRDIQCGQCRHWNRVNPEAPMVKL